MFRKNYLKRLYNIDKAIALLKAERKTILDVVCFNNTTEQGQYQLIKSTNDIRKIDLEKYKKAVSPEVFEKSIGVSVSTAEKHLSSSKLKEVTYFGSTNKFRVIKNILK